MKTATKYIIGIVLAAVFTITAMGVTLITLCNIIEEEYEDERIYGEKEYPNTQENNNTNLQAHDNKSTVK